MSVALSSDSGTESNKDAYDAEFESDVDASPRGGDEEPAGPSGLCVDRETSCIYTN